MKNLAINWKTTLTGVLGLILFILGIFDSKTFTPGVIASIATLLASFGFIVSKDGDVTGIGKTATTIESALPLADALTANTGNPTMEDIHKIIDAVTTKIPAAPPVTVNVSTTPATAQDGITAKA